MAFELHEGPWYVVNLRGQHMEALAGPYLALEVAVKAGELMATKNLRVLKEVGSFA